MFILHGVGGIFNGLYYYITEIPILGLWPLMGI